MQKVYENKQLNKILRSFEKISDIVQFITFRSINLTSKILFSDAVKVLLGSDLLLLMYSFEFIIFSRTTVGLLIRYLTKIEVT